MTRHLFNIFDEKNNVLTDAELWLAGHSYRPDAEGHVIVPFTNKETTQFILLSSGGFSSFHSFEHKYTSPPPFTNNLLMSYSRKEDYRLSAGFYVDRESLLRLERAKGIVRAALFVSGAPASVESLEEVRLEITARNLEGIPSTKTIPNYVLHDGEESAFEFLVPDNARSPEVYRPNIDFLSGPAKTLFNLVPDENGYATIPKATLLGTQLRVHTQTPLLTILGINIYLYLAKDICN